MRIFGSELKAVVLDVDGVILDLLARFEENWKESARRMFLPSEPIRKYLRTDLMNRYSAVANALDGVGRVWPQLDHDDRLLAVEFFRRVEEENPYPLMHGSLQTIWWLKDHHIRIGLSTTNDEAALRRRFSAVGIDSDIFAIVNTKDSSYQKPDPRALLSVLESLHVPKEEALYVGDWWPDFEMAKSAHVRFIATLSGGVTKQAFMKEGVLESHIIERLYDLHRLIETP